MSLNNNQLDHITENIINLLYLNILDISNNNINDLPNCLGVMNSLNKLIISGNILRRLKPDIRISDTDKIKE